MQVAFRPTAAMAFVSNDPFINRNVENIQDLTHFFFFYLYIFLYFYSFIYNVTAKIQRIHKTIQIQPKAPHEMRAMELSRRGLNPTLPAWKPDGPK